ncbi:MAG TPA: hypothetical protein DCE52_16445 [Rhodobacteraceae bacterium]|nr:hypothetical protein [Paracoccaceae bacterium]
MTQTYKKKLIEVAIPLEAINAASAREKSIRHGHPSTLHLWWARRPLAACRAILFAQLVDDPSSNPDQFPTEEAVEAERKRLFAIIEELVVWENSTNEEVLEKARLEIRNSCGGELPNVYDPFSGGGSIPLEAQRLGLPAYGSDLNPVAVLIGKAMIEIPPKFKDFEPIHDGIRERSFYRNTEGLAEDVKYYGEKIKQLAFKRIGHLYPEVDLTSNGQNGTAKVIAWLWSRTVRCPNPGCGCDTPLLSSFILSSKKGKEAYLIPEIKGNRISFNIDQKFDNPNLDAKTGYKKGTSGVFECAFCKNVTTRDYVASEGAGGRLGTMQTAVVCEGLKGRMYLPAHVSVWCDNKLSPETAHLETNLSPNPRDLWCRNFGLKQPKDLFTNRQISALNTFSELVLEIREEIKRDLMKSGLSSSSGKVTEDVALMKDYLDAVCLYLSFVVDKFADYWSSICTWHSSGEKIRNTFGRQAIPMSWDFAETNPFSNSTGNWMAMSDWVWKAINGFVPRAEGIEIQSDAQSVVYPENVVISTDPPYYDNIGYADLSDFFYAWLKPLVRQIYPDLVSVLNTPKSDELVAAAYRHGSNQKAENFFLDGMTAAISKMANAPLNGAPVTIYYAFKQSEIKSDGISSTGWATFLQAVIEAGFSIVGTWPLRTEMANRMVASGTNALANSVAIVCRRKNEKAKVVTRADFIRNLKRELPQAITELQNGNISPADMPQSAIGPGMGVFSRYAKVLEADDSPMSVKTALQLINAELDEFLNDLHGDFDPETRFAATWFEQNGYAKGDFGVANSLATARGIAVESVKHAGIVESSAGKVRILKREDLDPNWDPNSDTHVTIWECCQYLVREYEEGGETAAAMLIKKMGYDRAEAVKDLAYYLYDICSNKRQDAKEATSYNALIAGWNDITRAAASIHDTDTTRQASLF